MSYTTAAPGVLVREDEKRTYKGKPDRYFTIRYRVDGKRHQEALGWASDGWNLTKAKTELARLKAAAATGEGAVTLKERRESAKRKREAELNAPTLQRVWQEYRKTLRGRSLGTFDGHAKNHLSELMPMRIEDLRTHHIEKLTGTMQEQGLAASTIHSSIALVRQIVFWGAKHGYNEQPPMHKLYFPMPRVDNLVTENLTDAQLSNFISALDNYSDKRLAASMKFALLTGVRRFAIFNLKWSDIDFINKQITLQGKNAKNHKTEHIPLTPAVEELLKSIQTVKGELVFGEVNFQSRAVKKLIAYVRPFLPDGFRPYHGLRHCYASRLATSGVSLFEIQKLLTHGNASMTQRYAHLCDSSLRRAASVMGEVLQRAVNENPTSDVDMQAPAVAKKSRARIQAFTLDKNG
ncbi:MAG: site-specific integrase [Desulfovibrio desulfuricans]|nr:site-specific integrase [Desulfovibrio desulfuricans]